MSKKTVSIVIPSWNTLEKIKRNLPEVVKVRGIDEIIVSDDASEDNSVEYIKENFPKLKLVTRERNGGFSSNVNTGFNHSSGDLVFLLNTDAIPEPNCVEKILHHFDEEKVFSVGFNTGGSWAWAKFSDGFFWHNQSKVIPKNSHQTLWTSGGSGVFRKSIWDKLGGFDELYNPFYEEDVDIGYRATKRGYINIWDPDAKVEHYKQTGVISERFSKQVVSKVAQRNQLIFIWKNITSKKLINQHQKVLPKMLAKHPKYAGIFFKALLFLPQVLKKRKIEIREQVISDEEILGKFDLETV